MTFWDHIIQFHELAKKDHPDAGEGRRSVRYIRSVLEPVWKDERSGQHPLRSRLGWAGAGNYQWLEQYAKKLHAATGIPGFGAILSRLGQPSEYVGAFSEVEIALKLRLAGLEISFVPPGDLASPDLTVKAGRTVFNIETISGQLSLFSRS